MSKWVIADNAKINIEYIRIATIFSKTIFTLEIVYSNGDKLILRDGENGNTKDILLNLYRAIQ